MVKRGRKKCSGANKTSFMAFDMKARRMTKILSPKLKSIKTRRGMRYAVTGHSTIGTKLYRFISKEDYVRCKGRLA